MITCEYIQNWGHILNGIQNIQFHLTHCECNGTDYRKNMISTDSWCPIVDCLILDPNHHLVILVHRIMLCCCLLVIMILILIIHYRFVSIITLLHIQHQNSYQDSFKSIPSTLIEKFQCAGSPSVIQQYILIWIILFFIVILLEICISLEPNFNYLHKHEWVLDDY